MDGVTVRRISSSELRTQNGDNQWRVPKLRSSFLEHPEAALYYSLRGTTERRAMKMKRPRGEGSSPNLAADALDDYCFAPFNEDKIEEITRQGNPNFARGAFGEISIAVPCQRSDTSNDGNAEEEPAKEDTLGGKNPDGDFRHSVFVAIKSIERAFAISFSPEGTPSTKLSLDVKRELCALQHLKPHPNIVALLACYQSRSPHLSKTSLSLVFPYSPVDLHLSLEWRRRTCRKCLGSDVIGGIAYDLFSALAHCHGAGILHRDIKPGNLLVSPSGEIQLCDFGLAKPFLASPEVENGPHSTKLPISKAGETGTKGMCTLFYRPPEVLLGGPASHPAIDMYSAGTVIVELATGVPLFPGKNDLEQLTFIFKQLGTPTDERWPGAHQLLDHGKLQFAAKEPRPWSQTVPRVMEFPLLPQLLDRLIALDPIQRITAIQALRDPFFSKSFAPNRQRMQRELIPVQLEIPPLLSSNDSSIAKQLAVRMARQRRTFLSSLTCWKGADLPPPVLSF